MTEWLDIDIEEYHSAPFVSHSRLKTYQELGPYGYYCRHVSRTSARKPTKAMDTGTRLEDFYCGRIESPVVKPDWVKGNTKEGKAWLAEHEGCTVIPAWFGDAVGAIDSLDFTQQTLKSGRIVEQPTFRFEFDGTPIQSRPDFWLPSDGFSPALSIDMKKCADLNRFWRQVADLRYYSQAAMVRMCSRAYDDAEYYLLAVEEAFPHRAQYFRLPPSYLDVGEAWVCQQLDLIRMHELSDSWPRVLNECEDIEPPPWMVAS